MATMILGSVVDSSLTAPVGQTNFAAVSAALAVLVADAASPTQAHVTTLNTAMTTFLTNDIVLMINSSANVASKNKLDEVLRSMRRLVEGSNLLT